MTRDAHSFSKGSLVLATVAALSILSIFFQVRAVGAASPPILLKSTKGESLPFQWVSSALLSCQNRKSCLADEYKLKFKPDQLTFSSPGVAPTTRVCNLVQGQIETFVDPVGAEYLICRLKDGSSILSWSLIAAKN